MSSVRKVCGPCTKSSNTTRAPRGTLKRSVAGSPCAARLQAPLAVGVLDAKQKPPAPTACEQQVEERGARVTEVQLPGGARGEAGNPLPLPARAWHRARAHDAMVRETCKAQQSAAHRCAVLWKRRQRPAGSGALL